MGKITRFLRSLKGLFYFVFTWLMVATQTIYGISQSNLATGTLELIGDTTTWLVIAAPVVTILLVIYFLIRRAASDEMDQKTWNKRITVAIVSCIMAVLAAGLINVIIGYYR